MPRRPSSKVPSVHAPSQRLVALRREHERLQGQIAGKREELAALHTQIDETTQVLAAAEPALAEGRALKREIDEMIDALLARPRQPKATREAIRELREDLEEAGVLDEPFEDLADDEAPFAAGEGGFSAPQPPAGHRDTFREVYLGLVRALHPDTAPDEASRARRTEAMKAVTAAYEQADLARLLELQALWVAAAPIVAEADDDTARADRLERLNEGLRAQRLALTRELRELQASPAMQLLRAAAEATGTDTGRAAVAMVASAQEDIVQLRAIRDHIAAYRDGRLSLDDLIAGPFAGDEEPVDSEAAEQAQALVYEAWQAATLAERLALAREALELWPDCVDALCILADAAPTRREGLALLEQAVAAGERAIGDDAFEEAVGQFWGILETRPYMRARAQLAEALWDAGAREAATDHEAGLLYLNPNDNQGIRYTLVNHLLELGYDDEVGELLETYEHDGSAAWAYSRALLAFRTGGDRAGARKALQRAVAVNPHVPAYLLGKKRLPKRLPDTVGFGDVDEAVSYAAHAAQAWRLAPGALAWLAGQPAKARRG